MQQSSLSPQSSSSQSHHRTNGSLHADAYANSPTHSSVPSIASTLSQSTIRVNLLHTDGSLIRYKVFRELSLRQVIDEFCAKHSQLVADTVALQREDGTPLDKRAKLTTLGLEDMCTLGESMRCERHFQLPHCQQMRLHLDE